jgi:hypothetical protein
LDAETFAATGDQDGYVHGWSVLEGTLLDVVFARDERGVNTLTTGVLFGTPVLVAGGDGGLLRIFRRADGFVLSELQIGASIQAVVIDGLKEIVVGTDMGMLAVEFGDRLSPGDSGE